MTVLSLISFLRGTISRPKRVVVHSPKVAKLPSRSTNSDQYLYYPTQLFSLAVTGTGSYISRVGYCPHLKTGQIDGSYSYMLENQDDVHNGIEKYINKLVFTKAVSTNESDRLQYRNDQELDNHLEVVPMAKIALSKVRIVNAATGAEMSYSTTQMPKEATLGNSYFATLNAKGIALLEARDNIKVLDEETWTSLVAQKFNLPADCIGDRGPAWATPEQRAKFHVFVGDTQYLPGTSAAVQKRLEAEAEKAKAKAAIVASQPVAQAIAQAPQVAVADKTPAPAQAIDKTEIIAKIKGFTKDYTKEQILAVLGQKVSSEVALELYNEATAPVVEAKPAVVLPSIW